MNDPRLLTPDDALPAVARAPAPWTLRGDGWILLLRLPEAVRRDPRHLPPAFRDRPVGGPSIVMFVDYADSPAGPYRELLYIPGRFDVGGGRHAWSVTRIYVSTWESVVNGRLNWGIPKDRADFHRRPAGRGEALRVEVDGRPVASFAFEARGLALPIHGGLLPSSMRRLIQQHAGRRFEFTPLASGRARLARATDLRSDGALFPELAGAHVTMALRVPRFSLTFPVADVSPARS
jgi:hypothetical protein